MRTRGWVKIENYFLLHMMRYGPSPLLSAADDDGDDDDGVVSIKLGRLKCPVSCPYIGQCIIWMLS